LSAELLPVAEWLVRPETQAIFAALDGDVGRTRAVGGVVRDTILQQLPPNTDIDLATELLPQEVIARAEARGIAHYPTGIEHGTVTLKLGDTLAEVTTLRRDMVTDGRHAVVAFGTDWAADAGRRDFTLNALYCAMDGALHDPLGALGDVLGRRVRFIGDPALRIAEDGLRVYRFFRFTASHGGELFDPEGLAACGAAVGQLGAVSRERVGAEMMRMLGLGRVARTLGAMKSIGLLPISDQALLSLRDYEQIGGGSVAGRLVLMGISLDILANDWRLPRNILKTADEVAKAARQIAQRRVAEAAYRHGEAAVEGLAVTAVHEGWSREMLAEVARELGRIRVPPFPISGDDLVDLGMEPGPALGRELRRLEQAWIESDFSLGKSQLLALSQI
jgi:poly(A) polymerase